MNDEMKIGPATRPGDVQAAIEAGMNLGALECLTPGDLIGVVTPAGADYKVIDLEQFASKPDRCRGVVTLQRAEDLIAYVKRFDLPEFTTLWVDADGREVTAVLNDHGSSDAHWGDHRAILKLKLTEQWQHWMGPNGHFLDQEAFAEHVEYGRTDVVKPSGADLLEIAQSIQGKTDVTWKAARRLADGQVGMEYVEDVQASAGHKQQLLIPEEFELGLRPFVGEEAYKVTARLRWRITGGNVKFGYRLDRPEEVLRDAVGKVVERIAGEFGAERVFQGTPRGLNAS